MKKDKYPINPEEHIFCPLCITPNYQEWAIKLFKRLPKKVKKRLTAHYVKVSDFFNTSSNPNIAIDGETLGCFYERIGQISLCQKHIFSEEAFMALLAHEVAHAYVYYSNWLVKIISKGYYKIKLNLGVPEEKNRYYHYQKKEYVKEYQADSLVRKWGLKENQKKLWKEMIPKDT